MVADELAARRWFRQRLEEIGEQYPALKTPVAQERLAGELARQAREGEGMAEVGRRGRPKGSTTATVALETVSFKAPKEFMERLRGYAKQHRQSVSELIRDGLEWRLNEGDPLAYRYGGGSAVSREEEGNAGELTALRESLTALVTEVREMRIAMQALEQRETGSFQEREPKGIIGNTITGNTENASGGISAAARSTVKADKAAVKARIHQLQDQGLSYAKIAAQLQAEGVPTLSGRGGWQPGMVRKCLGATEEGAGDRRRRRLPKSVSKPE